MRMKFACAQCLRVGLISEPDKALKYCTARVRHGWTKEQRVLLVKSHERNKWVQVRPLPHAKNYPLQYDICNHILEKRKCTYTGNCTFAHSQEEKELWTYMKNNDLRDMQQIYDMWLSLCQPCANQNRQSDEAVLNQPNPLPEEKSIVMPTDYADPMNGLHCRLCGRHSNSMRQWQQHISSERHKDRVFSCEGEDEALTWSYRFPGPRFEICSKLDSECPEGVSCDFAHSKEELQEWLERRDFLRRRLAKAKEDMLIMPDEFDFGKYNFLLQD